MTALAERNPNWRGTDITYTSLHKFIRDNFPKPRVCWACGRKRRLDWALKPGLGELYRDGRGLKMGSRYIGSYLPLCRSCHTLMDHGHELTTFLGTKLKFGGPQ